MAVKILKCEKCGEIMHVDESTEMGFCPFCGTKYDPEKTEYYVDEADKEEDINEAADVDAEKNEIVMQTDGQEIIEKSAEIDPSMIIDEQIQNDSCYDSEKDEFFCPYCLGNDVKHKKRHGILAYLGGCFLGTVALVVIIAIDIQWLTRLYMFWYLVGIVEGLVKTICNKVKPKWSWDMHCNRCDRNFIWDPTIKKVITISGDKKEISPETEKIRNFRKNVVEVVGGACVIFSIWFAVTGPRDVPGPSYQTEQGTAQETTDESWQPLTQEATVEQGDIGNVAKDAIDGETGENVMYGSNTGNFTTEQTYSSDTYIEFYEDVLEDIGVNSDICEYLYYDLDKDGRPEMIIGYGSSDADFAYSVYTIDNQGYVVDCGAFPGSYLFYEANDGNGLYAVAGNQGVEHVYRITLDGQQVNWEELWTKEISMYDDYFSNDYPVQAYTYENSYYNDDFSDSASDSDDYDYSYIIPGSDTRLITEDDLYGFDADMCKLARNEIYARHGRIFEDEGLNNYFNRQTWYVGYQTAEEFDDAELSDVERKNLDTIVKYEKEQGYR